MRYKDGTTGNWWFSLGGTWVGYWPCSLFDSNGRKDRGVDVGFGGEIFDNAPGGAHTRTDMGYGKFPNPGWQQAAYQKNIKYINTTSTYTTPALTRDVDNTSCYELGLNISSSWGKSVYFGGSGLNGNCP